METPELSLEIVDRRRRFASDEHVQVDLQIRNTGNETYKISEIQIYFGDTPYWWPVEIEINMPVTEIQTVPVPMTPLRERHIVEPTRVIWHTQRVMANGMLVDCGVWQSTPKTRVIMQREAAPRLQAFLSRSLSDVDKPVGNSIADTLKRWMIEPTTIGEPERVREEEVASKVREAMRQCDGVVVAATPRFVDQAGRSRTFEYAQAETALAYASNKPVLILRQSEVELTGFLHSLDISNQCGVVDFTPDGVIHGEEEFADHLTWFRSVARAFRRDDRIRKASPYVVGGVITGLGVIGIQYILTHSE